MFRRLLSLLPLLLALSLRAASTDPRAGEWRSADGAWCAYDGDFYSYANATGQGVKIWIPPGGRTVRGIILFGNPGGDFGGDTRDKTRQRDLLEFAAWHDFAVGGVTGFLSLETEKIGRHVFDAAEAWAARGAHPELARAPFIFSGSSNAGMFSQAMLALAPERTLAITPNVGPYFRGPFTEAHREVPSWIHIGLTDPFFPAGVETTEKFFSAHAPQGARWVWDAEIKGHETVSADHVDVAFWNAIIPLRLPAQPGEPLRTIPYENGWWADLRSWDHGITRVAPATEPKPITTDPARYGWLPTEGIARLYQATATRARNLTLSVADAQPVAGGQTSGVLLSTGGGYVASGGDKVKIRVTYAPLQGPPRLIEVYDQEKLLGTFDPAKSGEFTFDVPSERAVLALHLRGLLRNWDKTDHLRVSNPVQIVVRHPERSALIEAQLAANAFPRRLHLTDPEPVETPANPNPAETLPARRLAAHESASLRVDSAVAPLWTGPDAPVAVFTPVFGDKTTVQAAWSDLGLHLRFRIRELTTTADNAGRVDFHVARASLAAVHTGPADPGLYAAPKRHSVLRSALQFSFPLQTGQPELSVNRWEPWDCVSTKLSPADAYAGTGAWVDIVDGADGARSAEIFLPWKLVGNPGFARPPSPGTSLAACLGYAAPGKPDRRMLWPYDHNPWAAKPGRPVYGQILFLP